MGITPDRFPGPREEEEFILDSLSVDPTNEGAMRYVNGSFRLRDTIGVFNPRTGGGGLAEDDILVSRGTGEVLISRGQGNVLVRG